MINNLSIVSLKEDFKVVFERIKYDNDYDFLSMKNEYISVDQFEEDITEYPSTNGLYTMYANHGYKKIRIYVATEEFKTKYLNSEPINTLEANPNLFYRGKHVNIRTFVKKQLLRAKIPGKYNNIIRDIKTYDDIVRESLGGLSVDELKTILLNKGLPYSNYNKAELIERLLNALRKE